MPASTTSQSAPDVSTDNQAFQFIAKPLEACSPVLTGMQAWVHTIGIANVSLHREWLGFVGRRLEADAALPQRFTACKAPEDAWRIYMNFLQTAADDYRKEAMELARLSSSIAAEPFNGTLAPPSHDAPPPRANGRQI